MDKFDKNSKEYREYKELYDLTKDCSLSQFLIVLYNYATKEKNTYMNTFKIDRDAKKVYITSDNDGTVYEYDFNELLDPTDFE